MGDPREQLARGMAHFNREEYRDALLAFEERWHGERTDFLRGLIQVSNALNQLRLGFVTAPRRLLASADALLATYPPCHDGFDVAALRANLAGVRACIPDRLESGQGSVAWEAVPRFQMRLCGHSAPPS